MCEHAMNNLGGGEYICSECGRHLVFDGDDMRVVAKGDFFALHSGGYVKIKNTAQGWQEIAVREMLGGEA